MGENNVPQRSPTWFRGAASLISSLVNCCLHPPSEMTGGSMVAASFHHSLTVHPQPPPSSLLGSPPPPRKSPPEPNGPPTAMAWHRGDCMALPDIPYAARWTHAAGRNWRNASKSACKGNPSALPSVCGLPFSRVCTVRVKIVFVKKGLCFCRKKTGHDVYKCTNGQNRSTTRLLSPSLLYG